MSSGRGAVVAVSTTGSDPQVIDGEERAIAPGDIVEVQAGSFGHLEFANLHGTAEAPIHIVNAGGQVTCEPASSGPALTLRNCANVVLSGAGTAGTTFGFYVGSSPSGGPGVEVVEGSTAVEIDHVEVFKAGSAGFMVKDEPTAEGSYNRGHYIMRDIYLHDNYVHDTGGAGFDLGHADDSGREIGGSVHYPHFIEGLRIENNHTLRTGAAGILIGSTRQGLLVAGNRVESPGQDATTSDRNNGIHISLSAGVIVGNRISDTPGEGILVEAQGDLMVANNVVEGTGRSGIRAEGRLPMEGSLATGASGPGKGFRILNNAVLDWGMVNPDATGILVQASDVRETNYALNNALVGGQDAGGAIATPDSTVPLEMAGNLWAATAAEMGWVDAAGGDFHPADGSPLIDAGVGVQHLGLFFDAAREGRTAGAAVDVGPFERAQPRGAVDPLADSTVGAFEYPYRLYTPPSAGVANPLPLIVFLHGVGEKGTDNERQVKSHIQPLIETTQGSTYAAFLVAPQAPGGWFDGRRMVNLVAELQATLPIDPSRIYVTGLSAGGQGTWNTVAAEPARFAAAVPLSGVASSGAIEPIATAGVPVWAFHGDADGTVNVGQSRNMIQGLEGLGALPRYTELTGWGHCCWSNVYGETPGWTDWYAGGDPSSTETGLYAWLFAQTSERASPGDTLPPLLAGERLLIDFGGASRPDSPDDRGNHWNAPATSATSAATALTYAVESTGSQTRTKLVVVDAFTGANTSGLARSDLYPVEAQSDSWYAGSFDGHAAGLLEPAELRLDGLDPELRYTLRFFASRSGLDGGNDRLTRYSSGGRWVDLDAVDNAAVAAELADLAPDETGSLAIRIEVSPAGTGRFAYLGVLEVIGAAAAPPAPGTFARFVLDQGLSGGDADPLADEDGDHRSTGWEFVLGSDPRQPEAGPIGQTLPSSSPQVRLHLAAGVAEGLVELLASPDLASWTVVGTYQAADGTHTGFTTMPDATGLWLVHTEDSAPATGRFFRFRLQLPAAQ